MRVQRARIVVALIVTTISCEFARGDERVLDVSAPNDPPFERSTAGAEHGVDAAAGSDELELALPASPGNTRDGDTLNLGLPPIGTESPESAPVEASETDSIPGDDPVDKGRAVESEPGKRSIGGFAAAEVTIFPTAPADPRQHDIGSSFSMQPEFESWNAEWDLTLRLVPFARWDQRDEERTHADLREFSLLKEFDGFDVLLGASHVFWGTTEAVHLVDVVNQTDLVEDLDQEAKLGQPMANVNLFSDLGRFSFFVLPYFRPRTFPGPEGRLRTIPGVAGDRAVYESAAEEWHTDLAFRYSRSLGDLDLGLSYFWGTVREPTYLIGSEEDGAVILLPFYEIVHQPGIDLSYTAGDWLIKAEGMYRSGQGEDDFLRAAAGFEYTFFRVFGTAADVGIIGEFLYDSAGNNDINPFENDIAYGLRFSLNDLRDSSLLLSAITDVDDGATVCVLEASMRFGSHVVGTLEGRAFANIPPDDFPLNGFRRDHYVRLGLEYHF